jgi:predicted nucleotidyltransferase
MKKYHNIKKYLTTTELEAIDMLVTKISKIWKDTKFKLFGSKVTGNFDEESDIDILILLPCEVKEEIRERIIDIVFDINLKFDTNVSPLILSGKEWAALSVLPIHYFIEKEGVTYE